MEAAFRGGRNPAGYCIKAARRYGISQFVLPFCFLYAPEDIFGFFYSRSRIFHTFCKSLIKYGGYWEDMQIRKAESKNIPWV
jgi:hypothetical protein